MVAMLIALFGLALMVPTVLPATMELAILMLIPILVLLVPGKVLLLPIMDYWVIKLCLWFMPMINTSR
jgi:hypothetical protein